LHPATIAKSALRELKYLNRALAALGKFRLCRGVSNRDPSTWSTSQSRLVPSASTARSPHRDSTGSATAWIQEAQA
jgi:hypothetical protein